MPPLLRRNRESLTRFGAFWKALQRVGDALADAEKVSRAVSDGTWKSRNPRHWQVATAEESRTALRRCRSSLRVMSSSAKKFEPELVSREWRR